MVQIVRVPQKLVDGWPEVAPVIREIRHRERIWPCNTRRTTFCASKLMSKRATVIFQLWAAACRLCCVQEVRNSKSCTVDIDCLKQALTFRVQARKWRRSRWVYLGTPLEAGKRQSVFVAAASSTYRLRKRSEEACAAVFVICAAALECTVLSWYYRVSGRESLPPFGGRFDRRNARTPDHVTSDQLKPDYATFPA